MSATTKRQIAVIQGLIGPNDFLFFFFSFFPLPLSRFRLGSRGKPQWKTACEKTPRRSCDLTGLLHHQGIYRLQVRASEEDRHSDWVSTDFSPDEDGEKETHRKWEESRDRQHQLNSCSLSFSRPGAPQPGAADPCWQPVGPAHPGPSDQL